MSIVIQKYAESGEDMSCPACGSQSNAPYGTVDTPPIPVQLHDTRLGIRRKWGASRICCSICHEIYDFVTVNEIVQR